MANRSKPRSDGRSARMADAVERMHARTGFLLRRAHQLAVGVFDHECAGALTPPQFGLLTLIGELPDIDQMSLARAAALDRTTVAVVITNLVKQGWVSRDADDVDGRRYRIALTPAGAERVAALQPDVARAERRLLSAFSPDEAQQFHALLRRFIDGLAEPGPVAADASDGPVPSVADPALAGSEPAAPAG